MLTKAVIAATAGKRVPAGAKVGSVSPDEDDLRGGAQSEPGGSPVTYEGRHRRPEPSRPAAASR
jgi:hypothetical protein